MALEQRGGLAAWVPIVIAALTSVVALATGLTAYLLAADAMEKDAINKLQAVHEARVGELSNHLTDIEEDLRLLAVSDMVVDGLSAFEAAWANLAEAQEAAIQRLYVQRNPFSGEHRCEYVDAGDDSDYTAAHVRYHPWFRALQETRDYRDIALIDHDGNVVYSVEKRADYGTNVLTGRWRASGLGQVFRAVQHNFRKGYVSFIDIARYGAFEYGAAGFVGTPVFDRAGNSHGVLVFQFPIDRINAMMAQRTGMGETGEGYLVGSDFLMRSDSRFYEQSTILRVGVDTIPVRRALRGEVGAMRAMDYRGNPVLSVYGPIRFEDVVWAILVEVNLKEVEAPLHDMGISMAVVTMLVLIIVAGVGLFVARSWLVRPLQAMTDSLTQLAEGNLAQEIPNLGRRDEIGGMARAAEAFRALAVHTRDRNWIQTAAAELTRDMQTAATVTEAANRVIAGLARRLGCGLGAFHMSEESLGKFKVVGEFGYSDEKGAAAMGVSDGLVRQCAREQAPILMNEIPADYLKVTSGTGRAKPSVVMLFPVVRANRLVGVIELAGFEPLTEVNAALVRRMLPIIALQMETLIGMRETRRLLATTQNQAEELRASEEELRAQSEALRTLNDRLIRRDLDTPRSSARP